MGSESTRTPALRTGVSNSRPVLRYLAWVMGFVVIASLLATGLAGRMQSSTAAAPAPSDIPTVTFLYAERGKAKTDLTLNGSIQSVNEAMLYARTNGYLKNWLVDIGDKVKVGQLLAEIETPELEQELQEAQAKLGQIKVNLELARTTAERYQGLRGDDAVSPQEVEDKVGAYEARKAEYAVTQAQIKRLQELRGFQRVVAPFSGTVIARNAEKGQLVTAGSSNPNGWLFKIAQTDGLRVVVPVPQSYLRMVRATQTADILVREYSEKIFPAKVTRHAGALDAATRTMLVELRPEAAPGELMPGMYCQVRFQLTNPNPSIVVPHNVLLVGSEGTRVAVVDGGNTVRIRQIAIGRDFGKEVEVISGIAEKDRVIMNPRDNIEDGTKVNPVLAEKHGEKKDAKPPEKGAEKPKS
jgi:RND family efflux transporter MFP subunit